MPQAARGFSFAHDLAAGNLAGNNHKINDRRTDGPAAGHVESNPMILPPGQAWRRCKYLDRERACLDCKIRPARVREIEIRPCDICPIGTRRAREFARQAQPGNVWSLAGAPA